MPKELLVIINMYVLCACTIFSIRDFSAQRMPGYQLHSCPYRLTLKHIKHISQNNNYLLRHVKRGIEDKRLFAQAIKQLRRQDSEALGGEQHGEWLERVRENRLQQLVPLGGGLGPQWALPVGPGILDRCSCRKRCPSKQSKREDLQFPPGNMLKSSHQLLRLEGAGTSTAREDVGRCTIQILDVALNKGWRKCPLLG